MQDEVPIWLPNPVDLVCNSGIWMDYNGDLEDFLGGLQWWFRGLFKNKTE